MITAFEGLQQFLEKVLTIILPKCSNKIPILGMHKWYHNYHLGKPPLGIFKKGHSYCLMVLICLIQTHQVREMIVFLSMTNRFIINNWAKVFQCTRPLVSSLQFKLFCSPIFVLFTEKGSNFFASISRIQACQKKKLSCLMIEKVCTSCFHIFKLLSSSDSTDSLNCTLDLSNQTYTYVTFQKRSEQWRIVNRF